MTQHFQAPACPLVVYTDLDGTLLDHDNYSFEAALPSLQRLQRLGVPVVPVTSKTLAELDMLLTSLAITGPCIAENGGLIALPPGYFKEQPTLKPVGRFQVEYLSLEYSAITGLLESLRHEFGFAFTGFADMDDGRVAELTGLDLAAAGLARRRLCSEPLLWLDTAAAFDEFARRLAQHGCTLVKGGRFFHVLGQTDKAQAMQRLNHRFSQAGFSGFTSIALGDSPNDSLMLEAADVAVVIRRKDGSSLQLETHGKTFTTRASGPAGWHEFFAENLDSLVPACTGKRTLHG
jgi:mannosyl-3-phosphoglycerate phosphatase